MKHVAVRRDAFRFNLQVVHAASVQKRDVVSAFINETMGIIGEIEQQLGADIFQGEGMIQGLEGQMSSVIATALGDLQTMASAIETQVNNDITCATEDTGNVENIMLQAGMLLHQLY